MVISDRALPNDIEALKRLVVAGGVNRASITLMSDNANWWIV